jgi:hypothetical protein
MVEPFNTRCGKPEESQGEYENEKNYYSDICIRCLCCCGLPEEPVEVVVETRGGTA